MPIFEIKDINESGAALFSQLTDAQLRSRQEPEKGIFISEGPKVTHAALDAGCVPLALLMRRKFVDGLGAGLIRRCGDIPVYTADDETLSALTGFRLQRSWVLCAMKRPAPIALPQALCGARRVALLEGITEPSNVGAIFRSAAALGTDAILLSPTCCDPLHRRAVRVCMGAVFKVKWARAALEDIFPLLKSQGFFVLGLALRAGCLSLDDPGLKDLPKAALCFGTEDTGLTDDVLSQCDRIVKIPMAEGIDSLNVAAAAAVAFWQFRPRSKQAQHDLEGAKE
ncbi:MAG: RNA methyltransferase [Clostridia bacterium]|nr:RNA methyltransferase [Clostridia bacterium]